jgi:hypothetical protein
VVALAVSEPEQPLLKDWIGTVPQRERKAQVLVVVGDSGEPILTPAIGT